VCISDLADNICDRSPEVASEPAAASFTVQEADEISDYDENEEEGSDQEEDEDPDDNQNDKKGDEKMLEKAVEPGTYGTDDAQIADALLVTAMPVPAPVHKPTKAPATLAPSKEPTEAPTLIPTNSPTVKLTYSPTAAPTDPPTCTDYCCTGQLVISHIPASEGKACADFHEVDFDDMYLKGYYYDDVMTMKTCNELCLASRRCKFFAVTNQQQCLHATTCGGFDILDYMSKLANIDDNPGGIYQMYCTVKVRVSTSVGAVYDEIIEDAHKSAIGADDDCPTHDCEEELIPNFGAVEEAEVNYFGDYSGYYTCAGLPVFDGPTTFLTNCYAKCLEYSLSCLYYVYEERQQRCQVFPSCSKLVFGGTKETLIYMTIDEAWGVTPGSTAAWISMHPPSEVIHELILNICVNHTRNFWYRQKASSERRGLMLTKRWTIKKRIPRALHVVRTGWWETIGWAVANMRLLRILLG
jgi:hypothetical protein